MMHLSVRVSCSDSDTFLIMEEVYGAAIPFEEHWGHTTLVKALWYFLHQLVSMVITPDCKFEDVIIKLVGDRYVNQRKFCDLPTLYFTIVDLH